MAKYCIDCGESLSGRADKKFCSDICRNSFNNKLNSDTNNYVRNINNVLRKNRRILGELNPKDKTTVHVDKLTEKGFMFSFYTHIYTTRKGDHYYFCYEHGYIQHSNNLVTIVTRRPEGDKVTESIMSEGTFSGMKLSM
jgi:hypothetical protein